jgi:hypothetical protein
MKLKLGIGFLSLGVVLAGCGQPVQQPAPTAQVPTTATAPPYKYAGRVGVPVTVGDPKLMTDRIASRTFRSRPDPFALLPIEHSFDQSQTAERLTQDLGYSTMYEPPEDTGPVQEVVEPQPYRRLAGVLVGDTVSAILIMENGNAIQIKPGMRIPDSPWRVVSIDEEKAVLRRAGNVKPTQIIVRLESPPGGVPAPQGGAGRPGGAGGPPPGVPGGPPGGLGGGRGGRAGGPGDG